MTNPRATRQAEQADDPRISLAEDLRDYPHPDPDGWQPALAAYERHLWSHS